MPRFACLLVLAIVSVYLPCRLWPASEQLKEEERPVSVNSGQHPVVLRSTKLTWPNTFGCHSLTGRKPSPNPKMPTRIPIAAFRQRSSNTWFLMRENEVGRKRTQLGLTRPQLGMNVIIGAERTFRAMPVWFTPFCAGRVGQP
jgi:hypothetical protein